MAAQPVLSPRAARTRAALISAGFDLLAEKPIDAIPIDEVVASGIADPIERIAGGMRVGAEFALSNPKRTAVLLRSHGSSTARAHPLNKGVLGDFEAACALGLLRPEAKNSGVLYWLGLCQVLMTNLIERPFGTAEANRRMADMLILGLSGLGASEDHVVRIASRLLNEDRGS